MPDRPTINQDADGGSRRAAEVNEAMLSMPGYADGSMLFMLRYGSEAKNTLSNGDWLALRKTIDQMIDLWVESEPGGGGGIPEPGPPGERSARMAELRTHALAILGDFPDLARDFDRFTAACRAATAATRRRGNK